jgi:capsid portal protein
MGDEIITKDPNTEVLSPDDPLSAVVQSFALKTVDDEPIIEEAFVTEGGDLVSTDEVLKMAMRHSMRCFDSDRIDKDELSPSVFTEIAKTVDGTSQTTNEIGDLNQLRMGEAKVIPPPYPPEILSAFLEVDPVHFRCVRTKVTDAVGRSYTLEPTTKSDNSLFDPNEEDEADMNKIREEVREIRNFIQDSNKILGFEGVLDRVWMDYESVGWGAIEVIRSRDMKVRHFAHVPATRVRVLKGWKGFVEIVGANKFVYYQNFGDKVVNLDEIDPISGQPEPYNPSRDGEIDGNLDWNLIDRETGESTSDINKSANELIWIPRHHSNTIYYGMTDVIPALGDLLSNVNIRDYILQFFEHNTIPRYAIVIEGAKMAAPVQKLIMEYFNTHVKGKPHKTLIIPVPSIRGEVKVKFEKLDAEEREASYQDTRKNQDQHIMTSHGVSPAIIGISEHSELGSGKGLSQAEIYKDRIVAPSQRKADSAINKVFRIGLGVTMVELRHIPLDIRDLKAEQDVLVGYQEGGAMTINEVRLKAKLGDPLKGGNRAFVVTSRGLVFVDELVEMDGAGIMAKEEADRKHDRAEKKMVSDEQMKKELAKQPIPPQNGAVPPGNVPPGNVPPGNRIPVEKT